ncbi:lipopolysaccharide transport periplasmic protein LptA [Massilia sp. RP-1-19]|uniref:Lipopolysaccharide export system protein LptA n=1 Tax=Massilia polaris TaxID=2728846 RepID=A0A848HPR4_9BURK|nr:lipopolysaccharide transport periplasmic protein LptA [Massilia polaris]NML62987.1 lipopolysaccharide transport periplasmic protein LptA [Massilia polaris]
MKKILLFIALCGIVAGTALAEKADSNKPTEIFADEASFDDVKQIRTLKGNVILTRGTLVMKAGLAVLREDPEGYQFVVFTAAPGAVATFRQKRDGGDLWVEGQAERIEYDNKTEAVKLFSKAKLARLEGSRVTDEVEGPFISYDSRKEYFTVENTAAGGSTPGAGRVRMVIQPSNKPPTPATPGK